jgi:serine protease Do
MSRHPLVLAAAVLGAALAGGPGLPAAEPADRPARDWSLRRTPVVEVVQRVRDAVVNIHSERAARAPAGDELFGTAPSAGRVNGMGTGIVIDPRGYIVTNHHVVDEVGSLRVRLADGTAVAARVLARDPESDLALIKVDTTRPLPTVPLGTATDLMVGETVIAVGNAYGYEHTVTVGVVSAVGRDVTLNKEVSYKALIQTDASINPGNSGGPLLNVHGELVGVNVAIRAGAQGIGFAIPVDSMIRVTAGLLAGQARGASAGLAVHDDVRPGGEHAPFQRRVVVDRVDPAGPAARAGVRRGDVLVRLGDVDVASSLDLERALLDRAAGDALPVVYRRGGAEQKVELALDASRPAPGGAQEVVWHRLGVRLQALVPERVASTHPQLHGGLLVSEVRAESAAGKAGIQRGDVLVGLHQWEMLSLENVAFVLNHPDLASFSPLRFYILRGGQVHRGWLQAAD